MSHWKSWLVQCLIAIITGLGAMFGGVSQSAAFVNQIVIDSVNTANYNPIPLGSSVPSTTAVGYTIYTGRIFGLLDPTNPLNSGITDINLASWSGFPSSASNGMVQYVSQFSIVTPTNPAQRSGLIIYEVSNRGGNAISTTALVQGATYVQSGWQGDLLSQCTVAATQPAPGPALYPCVNISNPTPGYGAGGGAYGTPTTSFPFYAAPSGLTASVIQVPVATTDGQPAVGYTGNISNNTITGTVYSHIQAPCAGFPNCGFTQKLIIYGSAFTPFQPAGYQPSNPSGTLTTTGASFWFDTAQSTQGVDTGKTTISNSQWSWAYCPNGPNGAGYTPTPNYICLNNGGTFNSSDLYEISFPAQDPLVQGVGWAATRDFVSFLRYGTTAPGGGTNPIAGSINKGLIIGVSQSGNFIRSLIFYGFNQDESGRIVFDGGWVIIASRNLWMMPRWSQPTVILNLYQGGNESPIWWSDFPNQARNLPAASLLDRCNASTPNTCPQILETWGGNEYFANKTAATQIGFCPGVTCALSGEIPTPANVYRYYVRGATHGGGTVSFNWSAPPTLPVSSTATYNSSPIPESYSNNALQFAFINHLMNGTAMPASGAGITFPGWAAGQLAPSTNQAAVGFPQNVPGLPFGTNQAWPPFVYDFGPGVNYANQSGIITVDPPNIQQVLTAYVPTVNADGNDNGGGIPSVLFEAPLATYMDWNIYPAGTPYAGQSIYLNGGFYPFWDTKANRTTHSDPRLSLEERYGTNNGYKCAALQAVVGAVERGFLLPSDATLLQTGVNGALTLAQPINTSNVLASGSPGFVPSTADIALGHNVQCGLTATHDFNGDYKSDVLWRDTSGNVGMWQMSGSSLSKTSVLGNVPAGWSIVGQRDFNGDGNADILWRDASGNVGIWLMNGTSIVSTAVLGNVPNSWSVAATGDFNGDGMGDIIWRDTSGNVGMWLMNGTTIQQTAVIGNVSTNWIIAGADNHGDIFWRNTMTGDVGMWKMNGTAIAQSVDFGPVPLSWTIAGTGDFDGNGSTDILWRDTGGNIGVWLLNGTQVLSAAVIGNVPLNWTIAQTGDYGGAGMSDILWTDSAGNVGAWFMNGATISSTTVYGNIGTAWNVQSQGAE